jgi:hypothetical protein
MATRLYFSLTSFSGLTPSYDGAWNYTSEAGRYELIRAKYASPSAITAGTQIGAWSNTAGQSAIDRQYISPPLAAQTISGTLSCMLMVREVATQDNVDRPHMAVKVIDSSGTVVATLLSKGAQTGSSTGEFSTSMRTQTFANAATLSSYACSAGDRLIVEIGYSNSTSGTTPEAIGNWGENATDATLGDNATTTSRAGWVEFSGNLTWAAPTVASVSPSSGSSASTTAITITGTNFVNGATVTVGGASATSVVVVSQTSITCVTPTGTVGAADVVVTNPDSTTSTGGTGAYTYNAPPAPVSVLGSRLKRFYHTFTNSTRTWLDEISGVNATNSASANTPAESTLASGYKIPDFDGNATGNLADFLTASGISGLATYNSTGYYLWFALLKCDALGPDSQNIVIRQNGTGLDQIIIASTGKIEVRGNAGTAAVSDSSILNDGVTHRVIVMANAATGALQMWVDGTLQTTAGTGSDFGKEWKATTQEIGARSNISGDYRYKGLMGAIGFAFDASSFSGDIADLDDSLVEYKDGAASGSISGSTSLAITFSGTLAGSGALTGSVPIAVNPSGTLSGAGALTGSVPFDVTFSGTGTAYAFTSGSVSIAITPSGTLTGSGALTGSVPVAVTPSGTLTGDGALSGSVPIAVTPSGTLTGNGPLSGSTSLALTFSGTLDGVSAISGSIPLSITFSGTTTGAGALSGSVPIAVSPSGTLTGAGALTGSVPIGVTPSGTLAGAGALTGSVPIAVDPAGTLTGSGALSGSTSATLTFSGTLSSLGSGEMSGSVPVSVTFSGTLTGAGALTGSVPIAVTPSAFLQGFAPLTGSTSISVTPSGTLTGDGALTGSVPIAITPSGTLTGSGALSGSVPIAVSFTGAIEDSPGSISGSIPIGVVFSGTLSGSAATVTPADITWTCAPATVIEFSFTAEVSIQITQSPSAVIAVSQQAATGITVEQLMTTLYVGDTNDIDFEFRDGHTDVLTDPTSVEISVQAPSESEPTVYTYGTDDEVTKRATGQYRAAISCTEAGTWIFTIRSPGPTAKGSKPGSFDVEPVNL